MPEQADPMEIYPLRKARPARESRTTQYHYAAANRDNSPVGHHSFKVDRDRHIRTASATDLNPLRSDARQQDSAWHKHRECERAGDKGDEAGLRRQTGEPRDRELFGYGNRRQQHAREHVVRQPIHTPATQRSEHAVQFPR